MAITRAQQAKQMLREGGRIGFFKGAQADTKSGKSMSPGTSADYSPGQGNRQDRENRGGPPGTDVVTKPLVKDKYGDETQKRLDDYREKFINEPVKFPKYTPSYLKILEGPLSKGQKFTRKFNFDKVAKAGRYEYTDPITGETYTFDQDLALENPEIFEAASKQLLQDRNAGKVDAFGNPNPGFGKDDNNFIPVDTTFAQAPSDTDQGTETEDQDEGLRLAFRADGGRIGAMDGGMMSPEGGIMDLETGRQMYFLGKLVKKATRAVKKVVKSPIGKAALVAGLGYGLGGGTFFGKTLPGVGTGGGFSFRNILPNLMGVKETGGVGVGFEGILGKLGLTKGFGSMMPTVGGGIAAASVLAGLLTPEQEDQAQLLADNTGIDIEEARNQILRAAAGQDDFRARAFKADGGIMRLGYQEGSKEPVAKKTMPLLDMDGKEMDLREDGGFVPIGRMEKADDVPARLSKNEFVFTADAVRNAGDGNVDKGAEVMYNMMKNLESGGDVSEESQGLEGAREMFQTSQRLEEVL
jgi:hypothetical protein